MSDQETATVPFTLTSQNPTVLQLLRDLAAQIAAVREIRSATLRILDELNRIEPPAHGESGWRAHREILSPELQLLLAWHEVESGKIDRQELGREFVHAKAP